MFGLPETAQSESKKLLRRERSIRIFPGLATQRNCLDSIFLRQPLCSSSPDQIGVVEDHLVWQRDIDQAFFDFLKHMPGGPYPAANARAGAVAHHLEHLLGHLRVITSWHSVTELFNQADLVDSFVLGECVVFAFMSWEAL